MIYQELLRSVLDLRVDAHDAGTLVKEIIGEVATDAGTDMLTFDPRITFLDTISIFLDMGETSDREHLQNFMAATSIPLDLMRQVLDSEVLMHLGFL